MPLTSRRTFQHAVVLYFALGLSEALMPSKGPTTHARSLSMIKLSRGDENNNNNNKSNNLDDDDDEVFLVDQSCRLGVRPDFGTDSASSSSSTKTNYMDDLTPPPINLARDSILFGENPSTRSNSSGLKIWQWCKTNLPPVFTGAWPWRDPQVADHNPIAGFYNMAFVRLPVVMIGVIYVKNLVEGHPLVMDFGQGPFEMSPLAVFAVLALILA